MSVVSNNSYFNPTSFSGCSLWLDAADSNTVIRTGNNITQWNDKSGNGYNATPSNTPTYISSNINMSNGSYFNGSINIAAGTLVTTAFTVAITPASFAVETNRILSVNNGIGNDYNSPSGFVYSSVSAGIGYAYRTIASPTTGTINTTRRFLCTTLYFSNGGFVFSYNGNFPNGALSNYGSNINSSNTNNLTKYYIGVANIGGNSYNTGQIWNGGMNEVIIYNRTLSQNEYQQVEGYLAWKWGLQRNLPISHPYYYNPVLPNLILPSQLSLVNTQSAGPFSFFNPTSVSGCALWLDAADSSTLFQNGAGTIAVTASGQSIGLWKDKSGNEKNATAGTGTVTLSINRLNNQSMIRISRLANLIINNFAVTRAQTCFFCVFRGVTTTTGNYGYFIFSRLADNFGFNSLNETFGTYYFPAESLYYISVAGGGAGTRERDYGGIASPNPFLNNSILAVFGNAGGWLNGTNQPITTIKNTGNPSNTSLSTPATYMLGGGTGRTDGYDYDLAEVIVYDVNTLTTSQRQQIEGYLAWKWGVAQNLPENHPYAYNPLFQNLILQNRLLTTTLTIGLPTAFSGLALWLDAADSSSVIRSGSNVTQWNDKSGNGRNVSQSRSLNQPVYLNNTIIFSGSNNLAGSNTTLVNSIDGSWSAFSVALSSNATTSIESPILDSDQLSVNTRVAQFLRINNTGKTESITFNNTLTTSYTATSIKNISANISFIVSGINTSSNITNYLNGISGNPTSHPSLIITSNPFTVGARVANVNSFLSGRIYEVILYNTSLTTAQRQQIEGYLAWKWGLQANLPSNHPYALFPPN